MQKLLCAIVVVLGCVLAPPAVAAITWQSDWNTAAATAKAGHKLIIVDFYTDWCEWCKKLDSDVYPNPSVVKASSQYVMLKLDAEREGKSLAAKYNVSSYPMVIFLDANGTQVELINGYEEAPAFAKDMNRIAKEYREFPNLGKRPTAIPSDNDEAIREAEAYSHRGRTQDALAIANAVDKRGGLKHLGSACNDFAGMFGQDGKVDRAEQLFNETLHSSKSIPDLVQAHIGLFVCYANTKQPAKAKAQLQAIVDLPGVDKDNKQRAKHTLDSLYGKAK